MRALLIKKHDEKYIAKWIIYPFIWFYINYYYYLRNYLSCNKIEVNKQLALKHFLILPFSLSSLLALFQNYVENDS